MTENQKEPTNASSTLKVVAAENLVSEAELKDTIDKPLEEILNAAQKEQQTTQTEQSGREEATKQSTRE